MLLYYFSSAFLQKSLSVTDCGQGLKILRFYFQNHLLKYSSRRVAELTVHAVLVTETHNFTPPTVYIFDGSQTYVVNYINPFPLHFVTARTNSAPIVLSVLAFTMSGHDVSVLLLGLGLPPPAQNSYLIQIIFFQIFSCSAESKNRAAAKQNSPLMFT